MTGRVTEEELAAYEAAAKGIADLVDPGDAPAVDMAMRLVAEVRRLRGLIVAALPTDHTPTHWMSPNFGTEWVPGTATLALLDEARAIREETR